jgi:hypothetical protein
MALTPEQRGRRSQAKGHFGAAYVQTIAAGAGFGVQISGASMDGVGVDLTVCQLPPSRRRARELHIQVKCSSGDLEAEAVVVDLPIKNYDELREEGAQVPLVLVVVIVPEEPEEWIHQTEEQLVARRCAWWVSLVGQPARANRTEVRVRVPRTQIFTPDALRAIMERVAAGGQP